MLVQYIVFTVLFLLAIVALVGLLLKARNTWNRTWAIFTMLTLIFWVGGFWLLPARSELWAVYMIPLVVLAVVLGAKLAKHGPKGPMATSTDDPFQYTQEELRGTAATREALTIMMAVLALVCGVMWLIRFALMG